MKMGPNPNDPFEAFNRRAHKFNMAFDATMLRPPARLYKKIMPLKLRHAVSNFYSNLQLLPTIANDVLQGEFLIGYKDSWRFFLNSTFGLGGVLDVAQVWGLPYHSNDLGITLAKWGDLHSPYLVVPFFGPSTLRDTAGITVGYNFFTIYPYIKSVGIRYGLLGLQYVELRAQLMDREHILKEALDEYAFIRDAYLQNRAYQIEGERLNADSAESLYIESEEPETSPLLTPTTSDARHT
jgi:phospholipid-binding lipoprotein MlaA